VLDAALELFNERGTAAVSTDHVAARARAGQGNLYYWFGDKGEIVRELYAQFVAAVRLLGARPAGAARSSVCTWRSPLRAGPCST